MDQKTLENLTGQIISRVFVPLEASGRHVHITKEQALTLFGHPLTASRPLSQPGQYLANERLTIQTEKGAFRDVAVLGPERKEAQVEISLTDARVLGLTPPVRQSGDTKNSPGITLKGCRGSVYIPEGVIAASRHIHLNPQEAAIFGVKDRQIVSLQVYTKRPAIFQDVLVRVHPSFSAAVHLDYDEANGCGMKPGDLGRILP